MFNRFKKAAIEYRTEENILYEYVLDELEEGTKIKGIWGRALANSDGDVNKANSLYLKYRVQEIKDILNSMKIAYEEASKRDINLAVTKRVMSGEDLIDENTEKTKNTKKNIRLINPFSVNSLVLIVSILIILLVGKGGLAELALIFFFISFFLFFFIGPSRMWEENNNSNTQNLENNDNGTWSELIFKILLAFSIIILIFYLLSYYSTR